MRYLHTSSESPHNVITDGKGEKNTFRVREPGGHLLNQCYISKRTQIIMPPNGMQKKQPPSFCDGSSRDSEPDIIEKNFQLRALHKGPLL